MKITVSRALKERARLAGKLGEIFKLIRNENSVLAGATRTCDIREKFVEYKSIVKKMTAIKAAVTKANAGIAAELAELAETKSMITQLKSINVVEGKQRESGYSGASEYEMEAAISKAELYRELELLQDRANMLQDKIDEFNAKTSVEVEL